jgi:hypothetical protein
MSKPDKWIKLSFYWYCRAQTISFQVWILWSVPIVVVHNVSFPVAVSINGAVVTSEAASVAVSLSAIAVPCESVVTASTVVGWSVTPSALVVSLSCSAPWPFPGLTDVKTSVLLSVDVSRWAAVVASSAASLVPAASPVTASTVAAPIVVSATTIAVVAGSTVPVATAAEIVAVVPGGKTMVVPSASIAVAVCAAVVAAVSTSI